MTRKDYIVLAEEIGKALYLAEIKDGMKGYRFIMDCVYYSLTNRLEKENPNFDRLRFSHACAIESGKYLRGEKVIV